MKKSMKTTVSISILAMTTAIAACTSKPMSEREPSSTYGRAKVGEAYFFEEATINSPEVKLRRYDLNNAKDLAAIESGARAYLKEHKRRKKLNVPETEQVVVGPEVEAPFNKFDYTDGPLKKSAEYLVELFDRGRKGELTAEEVKFQISQIGRAIQLNYTEPIKNKYEILMFPVYLARALSTPSVSENYKGQDPDFKLLPNELIQEKDISKIDLTKDFRFKDFPSSCQYEKAKRGFGVHAGFHIKCGDQSYKMKFGNEEYSGPFNSRIYRSLGFITPHINHYETLNIDYDRRVLIEFNQRMRTTFKLTFATATVFKKTRKTFISPFPWMKGAILKNGTFVDAQALEARLITREIKDDITEDMIDKNFESQIDKLVFGPSTLTLKDDPVVGEEIGSWVPADFNYRDFKEIRGLMVLAAWTGNHDIRKDNLRLSIIPDSKGKKQLRLTFGDAGSGLGDKDGVRRSGSDIDDMDWEISSVFEPMNNDNRFPDEPEQSRITLSGLGNLEYSQAFSKIKLTDAQWMLRKLCQFSPEQLKSALVSSGLSSAEVVLAQAKLLERRNKMMEHFKVDEDFKASCYVPVNRKLNYDPQKDPLVSVVTGSKGTKTKTAPDQGHRVINGKLIIPE